MTESDKPWAVFPLSPHSCRNCKRSKSPVRETYVGYLCWVCWVGLPTCKKCGRRMLGGPCDPCSLNEMRKTMVLNKSSGGLAQENGPSTCSVTTRAPAKSSRHVVRSKPQIRGPRKKKNG